MPSYLHPGVYIEEIPSGVKPIEGVSTSTAAFVGYTAKGPIGDPQLIFKQDDYLSQYGGVREVKDDDIGPSDDPERGDPMGFSVAAFFQNGGTKAYIVRLAAGAISANAHIDSPAGGRVVTFTGVNEGTWADDLIVRLTPKPSDPNLYRVDVGREDSQLKFVALESFADVSFDDKSPRFITSVVNGVSENVGVAVGNPLEEPPANYDNHVVGTLTSRPLSEAELDLSGLDTDARTLSLTLNGTDTLDRELPAKDFGEDHAGLIAALAIENRLTATIGAGSTDSSLVLTLTSTKIGDGSSVHVTGSPKLLEILRLGADETPGAAATPGTSQSGDLENVDLDLSAEGVGEDDRRLKLVVKDGVGSTSFDFFLDPNDFTNELAALAAKIEAEVRDGAAADRRTKFTAAPDGNTLLLTCGSTGVDSAVVVEDSGVAPRLRLGVREPKELSGVETTGTDDTPGTSKSSDLAAPDLDLSGEAARTLTLTVDAEPAFDVVLEAANYTDRHQDLARLIEQQVRDHGAEDRFRRFDAAIHDDRLVMTSGTRGSASKLTAGGDLASALNLAASTPRGACADGHFECRLAGGADGNGADDQAYGRVFAAFEKIRDISILCLPDKPWIGGAGEPVVQAAISHAEKMKSRMVIVDPPTDQELVEEKDVTDLSLPTSTYSVLYYPWVKVTNPFFDAEFNPGVPSTVLVPPCGYAAGMWSKIDSRRGVWKAPAGVETALLGLAGTEHIVEDAEQDQLNPLGVNALRTLPGFGNVIWGARTLATKAAPEWRYVPVRRTAIFIEQSLFNGIQWAVFEPNDHNLWSSLRANIHSFMNGLHRLGAFQGAKASDAFFVRCGLGDTMTQGDIDRGQVIVIVGFAPLKPAEFVIVRIQQKVAQK